MVLQKDERIGSDEHVYVCLLCDTQFVHFSNREPVCPKCGAQGNSVAQMRELEEDDESIPD